MTFSDLAYRVCDSWTGCSCRRLERVKPQQYFCRSPPLFYLGRVLLGSAFALDRSCHLQERSRSFSVAFSLRALLWKLKCSPKTKMYLFWQQFWVTFPISDTNFINILSANKCRQQIRKNDRKNTLEPNKTPNEITVCLQTNTRITWPKLRWSKYFMVPKKWDRSRGDKWFS